MKAENKPGIDNKVLLILILALWAGAVSCHRTVALNVGSTINEDHLLKEYELDNARFEPRSTTPLQPSVNYWLRSGDTVDAKWDTFEFHWERLGTSCDFRNPPNNDCRTCDYCSPPADLRGPPCFGTILNSTGWKGVVAHDGFVLTDTPKVVVEYGSTGHLSGCPNNTPASFDPAMNATYQLIKPENSGVAAESKIHVVPGGTIQWAAYQLKHEVVDGRDYWMWSVGDAGQKWLENYSAGLRVTDVRIRRGECIAEPSSGDCIAPETSPLATASRLLFLPSFPNWATVAGHPQESSHRCYLDPNAAYIRMTACRETYAPGQLPAIQKIVTPTYENISSLEKLTWFIEFNTAEGGEAMTAGEPLIIEFKIEA